MNIVTAPPWSADGVDSRVVLRDGTVATLRTTRPADHNAVVYASWRARPSALLWSFEDIRGDEARAICRHALETRGDGWLTRDEVRTVLGAVVLNLASEADVCGAFANVVAPGHGCRMVDARLKVRTLA